VIGGQKWTVILGMPWLACHNPEIDWRTGEVKMTRCLEECGKQWRLIQEKSGWEKQKEEKAMEEARKKREKKKKQKKKKTMEARKVAEEWEIWDEKKEVAKSEAKAKELVPEKYHQWIKVFGKKQSERITTRKLWDHAIEVKEGKGLPIGEGEKGGSKGVYLGAAEERVHPTIKITTDGTGILRGEKEWKKNNGPGLSVSE